MPGPFASSSPFSGNRSKSPFAPSQKTAPTPTDEQLKDISAKAGAEPSTWDKLWANTGKDIKSLAMLPLVPYYVAKTITEPDAEKKLSEMGKQVLSGQIEYFKGYRHPVEHFIEDPLFTVLDVASLASLGAPLVAKGAATAGAEGAAKMASSLGKAAELMSSPAALIKYPAKVASEAATKAAFRDIAWRNIEKEMANLADKPGMTRAEAELATKEMLREKYHLPEKVATDAVKNAAPIENANTIAKLGSYISKQNAVREIEHVYNIYGEKLHDANTRAVEVYKNAPLEEFRKEFGSEPTAHEIGIATEYSVTPNTHPSFELLEKEVKNNPRILRIYQQIKKIGDEFREEGIAKGWFTPEEAHRRLLKPYASKAAMNDLVEQKYDEIAQALKAKGWSGAQITEYFKQPNRYLEPDVLRHITQKYQEPAAWDVLVNKKIDELMKAPPQAIEHLAYHFPITERAENISAGWTDRFMGNLMRSDKAGFMKHYTGGREAFYDPFESAVRWKQKANWMEARKAFKDDMFNILDKYGLRRELGPGDELRVGERRYDIGPSVQTERTILNTISRESASYAQKLNERKMYITGLIPHSPIYNTVNDIMPSALDTILTPLSREASYAKKMGVHKAFETLRAENPAYAIPKQVADFLDPKNRSVKTSAFMRYAVDYPVNEWKMYVLGLSPRWVAYNTVGNVMFSALQMMDHPLQGAKAFYRAFKNDWKSQIPPEISRTGLYESEGRVPRSLFERARNELLGNEPNHVVEFEFADKKIKVYDRQADKTKKMLAWLNFPKKLSEKVIALNSQIENYFRNASYLYESERMARMEMAKNVAAKGAVINDVIESKMLELMKDPRKSMDISRMVGDWFFNYWDASRLDKQIKRIIPFWMWTKNMIRFSLWTLPMEHPLKFRTIILLNQIGEDFWREDLKRWGVNPDDLSDYLRGSVPIGIDKRTNNLLMFNTKGPNPFNTFYEMNLEKILSSASPVLKVIIERAIHREIFSGKDFDSPFVWQQGGTGRKFMLGPDGHPHEVKGVNPPLFEHIGRQIPQYQLLTKMLLAMKYGGIPQTYSTMSLPDVWNPAFVKPAKEPSQAPRSIIPSISGFMGLPVSEVSLNRQQPKTQKVIRRGLYNQLKKVALKQTQGGS